MGPITNYACEFCIHFKQATLARKNNFLNKIMISGQSDWG
jgi:hypothetical protein